MITGFDSDIAILLLAAAIIASVAVSWWTYAGNMRFPAGVRGGLMALRALALIILAILLFDPVYEYEEERRIKRNIAVLLDNSQSMTIEKGDWQGEPAYRETVEALGLQDTTDVRFEVFGFGRGLFATRPDSLPLNDGITNMDAALSGLYQQMANPDAIILLGDGIFNRGLDPSRAAERFGRPFFTIATGDTSAVQDVLVRNVFYNSTAFTNSTGQIRAEILNDGFPDRSLEVQLYRNNELADVQTIQTTAARSVHDLEFEVDFEEEGSERFRIEIPEIEGEWSRSNNAYSFTIDVEDDQLRILHLAFEIHPDVRALRNQLATDESIMASYQNWLGRRGFSNGGLNARPDTLDLVILHGFPHRSMPAGLREETRELVRDTNLLLLSLPGTDLEQQADNLGNITPIRQRAATPYGDIRPSVEEGAENHAVLEMENLPDLSRGPALQGPVRNFTPAGGARSLLEVEHRGSSTDASLLAVQQLGSNRLAQLNAHQWYLWRQSTRSEERRFYQELHNNLVKWTAAGVSDGRLEFSPTRSSFDESEPLSFRASLRSETGQPQTNGRISVRIERQDGDEAAFSPQDYAMRHLGGGRYALEISALPAGSYRYEAAASRRGEEFERQEGSFSVNESVLEFTDTMRRDALLRFMAESTDGRFFRYDEAGLVRDELRERGLLEDRRESFENAARAHHSYWWFLLVLALVGMEWTTRKYYDVP